MNRRGVTGEDVIGCIIIVCLALLYSAVIFTTGYGIGNDGGTEAMQQQAVEHGVAEYVCDPKTGQTTFIYKKCGEK